MRNLLVIFAFAFLLPSHVLADAAGQPLPSAEQPQTPQADPNEADLTTHKYYTNKAGETVHSPAKSKSGEIPSGASAQCRDGSYSFSRSRRGTCSHHGGVSTWY